MYKIIQNDKVIDVVERAKFVQFLEFGHIALTDKTSAQGIVGSDNSTVYSFVEGTAYPLVSLEAINADEFSRLLSLLNSGVEVSADESALAKAKRAKLEALSGVCKYRITAGFKIMLSDNQESHFALSAEDQLNLTQIDNQLANGEEYFIYHATNQPCKVYNRDDMTRIVKAFRHHVLYHTTYFNTAKQYIKSLTDIEKVNLFYYGADVIDYADDTIVKQILKAGEVIA